MFAALPLAFELGTPRERHVQRVSKIAGSHHLVLDFRLAEGCLGGLIDDRIDVSLAEGTLSVLSRQALIRMKRKAGRPQDLADIEKLEAHGE